VEQAEVRIEEVPATRDSHLKVLRSCGPKGVKKTGNSTCAKAKIRQNHEVQKMQQTELPKKG